MVTRVFVAAVVFIVADIDNVVVVGGGFIFVRYSVVFRRYYQFRRKWFTLEALEDTHMHTYTRRKSIFEGGKKNV